MQIIQARNVNQALIVGLQVCMEYGVLRDSRNGPVRVFKTPITTLYENPTERVLFWAERDANPFFHLMESLWMLAGHNDVEFVTRFASNMANYSDDGVSFHGAYGYRWRMHFGFDQIEKIIELLKANADDRRIVLQMWDPKVDLGKDGKDFPCNTAAKFRIVDGQLDMTVENRSNDLIWGAYGANAVHFSMLQEYIAGAVGVRVGHYWQESTNSHVYTNIMDEKKDLLLCNPNLDPYQLGIVRPFPIMGDGKEAFDTDLDMFMTGCSVTGFKTSFFRRVVAPMYQAHVAFKAKDYEKAQSLLDDCAATDWQKAAKEWVARRTPA